MPDEKRDQLKDQLDFLSSKRLNVPHNVKVRMQTEESTDSGVDAREHANAAEIQIDDSILNDDTAMVLL